MTFVAGVKSTFDNNNTTALPEIADGLKFLNPKNDGLAILKRLGTNGFTFSNHKYEWRETVLASRSEVITVTNVATAVTVADAYQYIPDTLLKVESEVMLITAIAGPTTLTVSRGAAGTSAVAHTAQTMMTLGTAKKEGDDASPGVTDNGAGLYNYDQIFERGVSLTAHEIAALSVEGNPLPKQLSRRLIEINRELFQAFMYGTRSMDAGNERYTMGGLTSQVVTNVMNVGSTVSTAAIDDVILAIIRAGGDPKTISVAPEQLRKLSALDVNLQNIGKREHTGGGLKTTTWQSTLLDHDLDIIVDLGLKKDELHINDWDHVKLGHLSGNGVDGQFHIVDSTKNGANRTEKVIRGDFGLKVELEKGQGYLYGLTA